MGSAGAQTSTGLGAGSMPSYDGSQPSYGGQYNQPNMNYGYPTAGNTSGGYGYPPSGYTGGGYGYPSQPMMGGYYPQQMPSYGYGNYPTMGGYGGLGALQQISMMLPYYLNQFMPQQMYQPQTLPQQPQQQPAPAVQTKLPTVNTTLPPTTAPTKVENPLSSNAISTPNVAPPAPTVAPAKAPTTSSTQSADYNDPNLVNTGKTRAIDYSDPGAVSTGMAAVPQSFLNSLKEGQTATYNNVQYTAGPNGTYTSKAEYHPGIYTYTNFKPGVFEGIPGDSPQTAKPNLKNFMDATGVDFKTASNILYGSVGSNKDTRDWQQIMSSKDPLAAAKASLKQG